MSDPAGDHIRSFKSLTQRVCEWDYHYGQFLMARGEPRTVTTDGSPILQVEAQGLLSALSAVIEGTEPWIQEMTLKLGEIATRRSSDSAVVEDDNSPENKTLRTVMGEGRMISNTLRLVGRQFNDAVDHLTSGDTTYELALSMLSVVYADPCEKQAQLVLERAAQQYFLCGGLPEDLEFAHIDENLLGIPWVETRVSQLTFPEGGF